MKLYLGKLIVRNVSKLTCVLTLPQMFPTMCKLKEICTFNQCKIPPHPHYPALKTMSTQ